MLVHHFDTIPSTNDHAQHLAVQGAPHGTVIHARQQTCGRGRAGRTFVSPQGGLYFSLIVRPDLNHQQLPLVTLAAGVGIREALKEISSLKKIRLKWPNDVYLRGAKIAGILTQSGPVRSSASPEFVIIGVGVNINTDAILFPDKLRKNIISLFDATGNQYSLESSLKTSVRCLLKAIQLLQEDKKMLLASWRAADYLHGKKVRYHTSKNNLSAQGMGLADNGRYMILDETDQLHHVIAGDINPIQLH